MAEQPGRTSPPPPVERRAPRVLLLDDDDDRHLGDLLRDGPPARPFAVEA